MRCFGLDGKTVADWQAMDYSNPCSRFQQFLALKAREEDRCT